MAEYNFTPKRRTTKIVQTGSVKIGYNQFDSNEQYPVSIQSMTNTPTTDVKATLDQINSCYEAGVDIMRVSVPDYESLGAMKEICKNSPVPIIADLHFNTFLEKVYRGSIEAGASCIRINPGTMTPRGKNPALYEKSKQAIRSMVDILKDHNCSVRIGVNTGSIAEDLIDKYKEPTPECLVESAMRQVELFDEMNFHNLKISVKASDTNLMIKSYELMAKSCNYPLHIGVTEAGPAFVGTIKSSIGLGSLLYQGIGDTMRISLSADPVEEVKVAWQILKSLKIRNRGVDIVSCPSCARQGFDVISTITQIESQVQDISQNIRFSLLGCIVNGLGEARESDVGVTGAKNGNHILYYRGQEYGHCKTEDLVNKSVELIKKRADELSM